MYLRELGLAICTKILVSEALCDLEVSIHSTRHKKLFVLLGIVNFEIRVSE
jgi:hypothetical protein